MEITIGKIRKVFFGTGPEDFSENPMFGLVKDSEMLHLYLFWRHFYWVFPGKFTKPKEDVFVIGKKVIFTDMSKIGHN